MIPAFTEDGNLPPGIHRASWDEFEKRFAFFDKSDRRLQVCEKLGELLSEVQRTDVVKRLLVAGSIVSNKAEPNDFDCILVLASSIVGETMAPFEYNLISRRMARKKYGGDVVPVLEGSEALREYLEFFQTSRDGNRVGIVEIEL